MRAFTLNLLCCISLLLPQQVSAQSFSERVDALLQASSDFSGAVLLAQDGQVIYSQQFGMANVEQGVALSKSTLFPVASITKSFTAILVMQLVEEGLLDMDNTIAEVLPELAIPRANRITIADLLRHTSGLPIDPASSYEESAAAADLIHSLCTTTRTYSKRGQFRYSNVDYWVLGLVIEKFRGASWAEVLQSRILDPLGMTQTGFLRLSEPVDGLALGYQRSQEGWIPAPVFHIENIYAAGQMYSTPNDLLKLDQALYTDQLLQAATIDLMYTSHPEHGYVAFGSWAYNYPFVDSMPLLAERRGGFPGYNHAFVRFLDSQGTLIILSNNDQFNPDTFGDASNLKEALIRLMASSDQSFTDGSE